MKPLAIITEPKAVSFWEISQQIATVLKEQGVQCKVYSWDTQKIPEHNILFMGNVFSLSINYLQRFSTDRNVLFYAVTEGNPILDAVSLDIAKDMKLITPSNYAKQCCEQVGLKVEGVVPHGIDLEQKADERFYQRISTLIPQPSSVEPSNVILTISGNVQRKALDKLLLAYKTVEHIYKDAFLLLHSGTGDYNIPTLQQALNLKRFLITNSWGLLDKSKVVALYKRCNYYVQPSMSEAFGLTYLEALAWEKPVIGVDCTSVSEIIKDGYTGILLKVTRTEDIVWQQRHAIRLHHFDLDELIDAMIALTDQDIRAKMSENARKEKTRWDMRTIYPQLTKYLE